MKIDISFLDKLCTVVWCRNKAEAEALRDGFSGVNEDIYNQLSPKAELFDERDDPEGLGFRFEYDYDGLEVGYASIDYYRRHKYNIIEFRDIVTPYTDYGDIELSYNDANAALAALF